MGFEVVWSECQKNMAYISASVLGSYRDEQVFGCLEAKLILAGGMGRGIYLHL